MGWVSERKGRGQRPRGRERSCQGAGKADRKLRETLCKAAQTCGRSRALTHAPISEKPEHVSLSDSDRSVSPRLRHRVPRDITLLRARLFKRCAPTHARSANGVLAGRGQRARNPKLTLSIAYDVNDGAETHKGERSGGCKELSADEKKKKKGEI